MKLTLIKIILSSFLASFILTPILIKVSKVFNILDHPHTDRKIHKNPIPILGGLAIGAAFIIGTLSSWDYSNPLKGVLLGSAIIIFVGLIDDVKHLPAVLKLIAQLIACSALIGFGVEVSVTTNVFVNRIITVFGVIGITNAVNFLDNMDGLAAGVSSICAATIFAIAYNTNQIWLGYLALSLCFACLGFLPFNFKPAKIFMGDTGSTFLGFSLASLAIMGSWSFQYSAMTAIAVPFLILGVFIFDTTLITILRIKDDKVHNFMEWIGHVDTDHFSHRLVALGLSQRQAVIFIYFCAVGLGLSAIFIQQVDKSIFSGIVVFAVTVLGYLGCKILDRVKPYSGS